MNTKIAARPALEVTRHLKARPQRVYDAWTDPAQLTRWFGPEDVQTKDFVADVRVGGKYRWDLVHSDGETMSAFGEYRELILGKKVVFTWQWDDDEAWENVISIVTVDFAERNGGTELTLKHEELPSEESRDRHTGGWNSILNKLEKLLLA